MKVKHTAQNHQQYITVLLPRSSKNALNRNNRIEPCNILRKSTLGAKEQSPTNVLWVLFKMKG